MGREKEGYREMLGYLNEQGYPNVMTKEQACKALGVGRRLLKQYIDKKVIVPVGNRIPIGAIAKILC